MQKDDIISKMEWWEDKAFTKELDKEYNAWQAGKQKGFTLDDIDKSIEILKKKRNENEL